MDLEVIPDIGVIVKNCNIEDFTQREYGLIRDLYYKHHVVVIKQNSTSSLHFARVCAAIGPIANLAVDPFKYDGPLDQLPVQRVTGILKDGQPTGIFGRGRLDWHCNMNGPTRAQVVGLLAVYGVENSVTSWLSTIPAYRDMPPELKTRVENLVGHYWYAPSAWAPGMHDFQRIGMEKVAMQDGPYQMRLLQKTASGETGMYFHYLNSCHFPDDPEMLDVLKNYLFQEKYMYHHHWEVGDIVISNQVVTLHKRQTDQVSNRLLHRYTFKHSDILPAPIS